MWYNIIMTLMDFVRSRSYLFWSTGNLSKLSDDAIVEQVLNYGDFEDAKQLMALMGIKKVAAVFVQLANRKRTNFAPAIKHYFTLYFQKYA